MGPAFGGKLLPSSSLRTNLDRKNVSVCSGVTLKNGGASVEQTGYICRCNDPSFNFYGQKNPTYWTAVTSNDVSQKLQQRTSNFICKCTYVNLSTVQRRMTVSVSVLICSGVCIRVKIWRSIKQEASCLVPLWHTCSLRRCLPSDHRSLPIRYVGSIATKL
jgi:hypothetical protein